ncbi:MAG: GNAT family N-acetyltransferase [Flavobacteriales bacterium]|nr:GNAT family N-acetyltransferase [Flavobacteriales bacterium]
MTINIQPTLENELVLLRPLTKADKEDMYAAANDPLIWDQHPMKRNKREVFDPFFEESLASGGAMLVIDKQSKKVIGSSRFYLLDGIDDAVEIGWTFLSRLYWGGKYNASFKKLMLDHIFKQVPYAVFIIAKENYRSAKAVEKIGGRPINKNDPKCAHLFQDDPEKLTYVIEK